MQPVRQETDVLNVNPEDFSSISLDSLDMQIVEQLKVDARRPIRAMARALGVSRETVRGRLNRLISENALSIVCVARAERLGYEFTLVTGVRVHPGYTESVAKELADLPGVVSVSLAGSRYNIFVWAVLRNRREFVQFVSKELTSVSNIMAFELMHSFHLVKQFWRVEKQDMEGINGFSPNPLSDLDLSIIKAIQQDPRQTITALADTVGYSRSVTRTRLDELVQEGVIGFFPMVNTSLRGYNNWVIILIKAEPNKMNIVVDKLAAQDATWNVTLVSGQWQVYAVALFKDSRECNKFSAETLSSIPGITEFEVIPLGKSFKYLFPPLPENWS